MKRIVFLLLLFLTFHPHMHAQKVVKDSVSSVDTTLVNHSPRKAMYYSLALPGLGQIYNQKYWKVPIVYAAIGTLTYFIIDYNKKYHTYVNAYNDYTDDDATTNSFENIRNIESFSDKTSALKTYVTFYQRWRDMDVLILAGVYLLNVIDANVDAHFFSFRIEDNLAVSIRPVIFDHYKNSKKIGIGFSLSF